MTTAPSKSRGTYARTAERRRVIARAVLDLVLEKGHAGVTTAEVSARAATSEPTVLYHFPTRDHLLVAALRLAYADDDARMPPGREALDLQRLRQYAAGTHPEIARLYSALAGHAGTPGHPAREFFADHYAQAVGRWTAIVASRQEEGTAHPGLDPAETARQFLAVWNGLQAQSLVDPSFDLGETLLTAFRRLTCQNWMEARALLTSPATGL